MARPSVPDNGETGWGDEARNAIFNVSDRVDAALTAATNAAAAATSAAASAVTAVNAINSLTSRMDALDTTGPSQTTTVTVVTGPATMTVNWTAAVGATGYSVGLDRLDGGTSGVTAVAKTSSQLTHTFTGLTNGVTYVAQVTISPSGAQRSTTGTPTAAAGGTGITLTKVVGDGEVTINWTAAADATGYLVGRNGTDSGGGGPWSTTDPAGTLSRTFLSLVNGQTYTFTVTPQPGGVAVSTTAVPVAGTAPVVDVPPAGAGTLWLSGAGDDNATNTSGGGFGTWRGEAATFARCWADASTAAMSGLDMMMAYKNSNWNGILDIGMGGPGRAGDSWASAATGSMDAMWRAQCQKINANWWTNCKGVHLSMAHELSGNWYPWSVNSGNVAAFKTAWRRFYNIVGEELKAKGKNAKVVLCYNFDTVSDISVPAIYPGNDIVDVIGVDLYNMWWGGTAASGLNTQALWDSAYNSMSGASPKGMGAWFTYAGNQGKPLSIPEWGASPQALVECPVFVTNMRNTFAAKAPVDRYNPGAGKIAGDAYFNTWDQCRLYPSTSLPTTANTYKNLTWGS